MPVERDSQGRVKVKGSMGQRLSTTAQDVAYAAAHGIDQSYGRDLRERLGAVGNEIPVVKTIKGRKNKPLEE